MATNETQAVSSGLLVAAIDIVTEWSTRRACYTLLFGSILLTLLLGRRKAKIDAPVWGYRSFLEPTILLQTRFIMGAQKLIADAYKELRDRPFVLRRYDVDFMVLPMKYLEEIRLIPISKLSSKGAQNLAPEWTSMNFLFGSHLHIDVLKKKLTPELDTYIEKAKEELEYGWDLDVPQATDWEEVFIEHPVRTLVARMTAKVFMGRLTCRDPEWLNISIQFAVDLFTTAFTIKMFPPWAYWMVVWFIPARYRTFRQLAVGRRIVKDLKEKHAMAKEQRLQGQHVEEEDTLLHWMLDHGTPEECTVKEMGARQCVLTLASIHTTASTVANMLYDLCAHPDWFDVLRQEIDEVVKVLGPPGKRQDISAKDWYTRLDKMDSFFIESQRHNPVLLLNPQRLAYDDIMLKDGTQIPRGTRLAFANLEHQMDERTYSHPFAFDPMRSFRKRQESAEQNKLHRAGMTHPDNLGFGYGNQACAGRRFAVAEIKLIMARLLYEFEFKFPPGKGRPSTQFINENAFTDQNAKLLIRRRR